MIPTVTNEGKLVAVVSPEAAGKIFQAMTNHPLGRQAAIIGEIRDTPLGRVAMRIELETPRVIDMPVGELLPRIC